MEERACSTKWASLAMIVQKRRLSAEFAQKISHWRHSGFHLYCGPPVEVDQPEALERLAAYIPRPSFAALPRRHRQVHYRMAKGVARSMDAWDWIAQVVSHIPDPGEQMVRYYGWYSNASRGNGASEELPSPLKVRYKMLPNRIQMRNISPASVVIALARLLRGRPTSLSPPE